MADIVVSKLAYSKILLHSAKYPHCSINGVLLADKQKAKDSKCLSFVDAVPLFHLSLSLAPMTEVALMQVDHYCKEKNLVIAGYYQANENYDDSQPNGIAIKIMEKIQTYVPDAILFMLDNHRMDCESSEVYNMYQYKEEKLKPREKRASIEEGAQDAAAYLIDNKKFRSLIDFDNHLDDISLDWKNGELAELVKHSA